MLTCSLEIHILCVLSRKKTYFQLVTFLPPAVNGEDIKSHFQIDTSSYDRWKEHRTTFGMRWHSNSERHWRSKGHKVEFLISLWAQGLVKILWLKFRRDFEAEVWWVFCCWCLVEVTKLNLGYDDYEAMFGKDFKFKFSRDADVWLRV